MAYPAEPGFHPYCADDLPLRAILVVGSSSFLQSSKECFARRGCILLRPNSAEQALSWALDPRIPIGLAVIDADEPPAAHLDLTADLARLRPGFPMLYVVGAIESVIRRCMEAESPASVLSAPFTEEQLAARVDLLMSQFAGDQLDSAAA